MSSIPDPKEILLNVLIIINYQDDKEKFTNEFLQLCMQRALVEIVATLSENDQHAIEEKLMAIQTQEEVQSVLQQYVGQGRYLETVQKATQELFQDYIQTILPTLNPEQKDKLQEYLASIIPQEMLN